MHAGMVEQQSSSSKRLTPRRTQALMRLRGSDMSCAHIMSAGYSGMPLSLMSTSFWFSGSSSAALMSARVASTSAKVPQVTFTRRRMTLSAKMLPSGKPACACS
jgi:hypothetical protein